MCTGLKNRSIAFDREVNVAWASNCMNYMIEKEGNKKKKTLIHINYLKDLLKHLHYYAQIMLPPFACTIFTECIM